MLGDEVAQARQAPLAHGALGAVEPPQRLDVPPGVLQRHGEAKPRDGGAARVVPHEPERRALDGDGFAGVARIEP